MKFNEYIKENVKATSHIIETELSDDALVQLSVFTFGSKLPSLIDKSIKKELISLELIDDKGNITNKGKDLLKSPKTIKRLSKIGEE